MSISVIQAIELVHKVKFTSAVLEVRGLEHKAVSLSIMWLYEY